MLPPPEWAFIMPTGRPSMNRFAFCAIRLRCTYFRAALIFVQCRRYWDVSTTMIHTHVLKVAAAGTTSPLDLGLEGPLCGSRAKVFTGSRRAGRLGGMESIGTSCGPSMLSGRC